MSNGSLSKMMTRLWPDVLWLKFAVVLGAGWLILALALPALGDAAPPEQAPGSSLDPAGGTQVRMVAERVILDIQASQPNQDNRSLADDRAIAQVSATFLMRNLGPASEQMQVRFPLQDASHSYYNFPTDIEGFSVRVAGQPVATTTITGRLPSTKEDINWAAFPVLFPPGQEVTIEVSYLTRPTGYLPAARFGYLLETGAGWRDTIGLVDIIARLPYPANAENVLLGPGRTNIGGETTPGGRFVGNEIRWHWADLEPATANNLFINILVPQTWERIVAARATVEAKPDDVKALLALTQAYEAAVTNRFPTESHDPYAALSEQTLARAVALSPDSPELPTQLARLKWNHLTVQALLPPTDPTLPSILANLHQALTLDPTYEPALTLLAEIKSLVDGPLPPMPPLQAWTVAEDGAVFVLDAANIVYQLAPTNLTPLAQSAPLALGAVSPEAPAYLLADENYLFVASQAVSQTLVLSRDDFTPVTTLRHAGPMALDPGKHLFMISAQTSQLLAYNPADLNQYPQGIENYCIPIDMAADPVSRRLYLHSVTSCGSSHHGESYSVYDLDSLAEVSVVGVRENAYAVGRPAVIAGAGLGAGINLPYATHPELITFDGQGHIINRQKLPLEGARIAASTDRFYVRYRRGLAVMRVNDLSLQSFLPFTGTIPTDLALSPDGKTLYLFGDQVTAYSTAELQKLGLASLSPFPLAWLQETTAEKATQVHIYPSPDVAQDGLIFTQLLPGGYPSLAEIYRSDDGGKSWRAFPVLADVVTALSLSPDFAADHTLVSDFLRSTDGGETWSSWAPRLAFVSDRAGNREIYTASQYGSELQQLTDNPAADENPAWSPAWTRLAFQSKRSGNWDIFSLRADCAPPQAECDLRQLTADEADDMLPAWSPDGHSIAFVSTRDGNPEIYVMDKDGQNQRRLTFNSGGDWRPAWLPDSQRLVFTSDRRGNNDIYLLTVPPSKAAPLTAEPALTSVVTGPADDRDPAIWLSSQPSSFGFEAREFLSFLSDRAGTMQPYVTLADGSTTEVKPFASADQAQAHPSWFRDSLLVAIGEAEESDIYKLTFSGSPQAFISSPGFDGQPAGGPVLWRPDEAASMAWLTERSAAEPLVLPGQIITPTVTATPTPQPTATPTPEPTPTPPPITIPTLRPVGHLGGRMNVVIIHERYAYLGIGPDLVILDVTNPAQPIRVGASLLPQEIYDIKVAGHLAYVLADGLRIVDVSEPTAPKEIGFYQTPQYTHGLTVANNKVYLAGQDGLRILDVSDPTAPVELGFCALTQVISNEVIVHGDKAYVATSGRDLLLTGGLSIVDISDPTKPGEISRLSNLSYAHEITLVDNWVYLVSDKGLVIVNVADPAQPVQSSANQPVAVTGLNLTNHYLYLTDTRSGLYIADITDPTQPVEVGFAPMSQGSGHVKAAAGYAYVVNGEGLHIFDVTNPATPTQVGQYLAPNGTFSQMATQGRYLYLTSDDGLNVIDVSRPDLPAPVSTFYLPQDIRAVTAQNHYLYVATEDCANDCQGAIHILDISNPISLTEVSRYEAPGRAFNLAVAGNYAYVNSGGLLVLDISDPATLRQVTYAENLPGKVAAIAGHYAYALGGKGGLRVLDISNPAAPVEVALQPVRDEARAAALSGHYLYLGERTFGFHVIDITNPTAPVEVNAVEDLGGKHLFDVEGMAVAGDRLYLTAGSDGLRVFDISNPAQPTEIGLFNPPSSSFADKVVTGDGIIYLSDRSGGLYLFQAPP
ncbi:MAG: hypothetical protein U0401_05690 [Anaerolineae bacterium]